MTRTEAVKEALKDIKGPFISEGRWVLSVQGRYVDCGSGTLSARRKDIMRQKVTNATLLALNLLDMEYDASYLEDRLILSYDNAYANAMRTVGRIIEEWDVLV